MPLTSFVCPDGSTYPVTKCLEACPRKEGRCLSLPVLHSAGWDRPFTKPSITQCLNPTRMEYLKLTSDYAIDPMDMAFALLGTKVHRRLDVVAKLIEGLTSEHTVEDAETIGTLDLLEPDEINPGCWKLIDSKTWGSYALAKVLGRKQHGEYDLMKATMQVNGYRVKVEAAGIKVSRLFIQAIVRDGGTYTAKGNGVTEKMMMIPIARLADDEVNCYFSGKARALMDALADHKLPPLCDYEERWGGRRCTAYCDVFRSCPEGAKVNKVMLEG